MRREGEVKGQTEGGRAKGGGLGLWILFEECNFKDKRADCYLKLDMCMTGLALLMGCVPQACTWGRIIKLPMTCWLTIVTSA